MAFPNPLNWLRARYPRVQAAIAAIDSLCESAEAHFPNAGGGIRRGREKLEWVRAQLQRFYNRSEGWGPAFDVVWPILAAAIERWVARRNRGR